MRDLAYLSMARTFYSASIKLDEQTNAPTVDQTRLSAAVKYWNKVDISERVLARRALRGVVGVLHGRRLQPRARQHPHDRGAVLPARELPRGRRPQGGHLLRELPVRRRARRSSRSSAASTSRSATRSTKQLDEFKKATNPEERVLQVPEGRARRQGAPRRRRSRRSSKTRLSDRQLLRNLEYVRLLDEEDKRFNKAPNSFKDSKVGGRREGRDARSRASSPIRNAGDLAKARYERNLERPQRAAPQRRRRSSSTSPPRSATSSTRPSRARRSRSRSRRPTSSSRTKSTSSGRSTASTGATSSGSTARRSRRSAGGRDESRSLVLEHRRRPRSCGAGAAGAADCRRAARVERVAAAACIDGQGARAR